MNSLDASALAGLTSAEARARLERDGPNELPRQERRGAGRIILEVLREPMLAMLLVAGAAYLLLGEAREALILLLFAGFSVVVTIVQEARTERVLESLRDLSAPRALVLRDGEAVRIAGREVVEGDVLVLDQGDRIAADALLLDAHELECDESLLTGESLAVRKRAAGPGDRSTAEPGGEDKPQVYAGTIITRGGGMARVTATGSHSCIGAIGHALATVEPEESRLQRETGRIVRITAAGGVGIALLVGFLYALLRGGWLDALLAGIAIGMSMLPEEFPVVLTIYLAMGAWRIAQAGVLTRRGTAIETMGAITVLCTDKTGTLTQNRMVASALWIPDGTSGDMADGRADTRFHELLRLGALASAPVASDPMELAFHAAAEGIAGGMAHNWALVHTTGISPELLAVSNVWDTNEGPAPLIVAAKGAPEAIARLCRLDEGALGRLEAAAQSMAARGMRVLGVASARAAPDDAANGTGDHRFELHGLVGLSDPLRSGVREAMEQCHSAGIRVVMITGDYAATAQAIAADAGLGEGDTITGQQVAALSDAELSERMKTVAICARIMPEQKLRIVSALKAAGEVVAMTGDGVNDAPALKAAHIGVAMGSRGTDVAREASSIVLVEDDFGAIVSAIRLGRRIYDNIRKATGFIFAVHVPLAGLALLPLLLGLPILLGPIQIALLEMIIDPVCALVFEAEREEENLMRRPPRDPAERLFSLPLVAVSILWGALALAALSALLLVGQGWGLPPTQLRTLIFLGLVSAIVALVLAHRTFSAQIGRALLRRNLALGLVLGLVFAASAAILFVDPVRRWFGFTALSWVEIALAAGTGALLLVGFEATKALAARLSGGRKGRGAARPGAG